MKKDLEIIEVENKVTNAEPPTVYSKFNTSEGWMACFNAKTCEEVKKLVGKVASVEVVESGKYNNITKCYGEAKVKLGSLDVDPNLELKVYEDHTIKKVIKPFEKDPVGLAVDVFCEIVKYVDGKPEKAQEIMKQSIELVKQAQEAFK